MLRLLRVRSSTARRLLAAALPAAAICAAVLMVAASSALAAEATFTASETIPVPPASNYTGSAGGDGWAVALSQDAVYNVFHHSNAMTVACHLQSDGSQCWSPETITDDNGDNFATSGHPGMYLDQSSGKLYVFGTRLVDGTGGVVCIDTTQAASNPNPFCGFTALTGPDGAPANEYGYSALSAPMQVGSRLYSFNYVHQAAGLMTVDDGGSTSSVTCPSASQCTTVDSAGNEVTFDPTTGSANGAGVVAIAPGIDLYSVSCPSVSQCTATDYFGSEVTFDPSTGTANAAGPVPIDSGGYQTAVSCPSSSECTLVDSSGNEATFDPTAGAVNDAGVVAIGSGQPLTALSCPTETQCTTVDGNGDGVTFDPTTGTVNEAGDIPIAPGQYLNSVWCVSASQCTAVDYYGNEVTFDPSTGTPNDAGLVAIDAGAYGAVVTCVSATQCTETGSSGDEVTFDPTTGTANAAGVVEIDRGAGLNSISCASATQCTTSTWGGREVTFDPTSGSPLVIDSGAPADQNQLLCFDLNTDAACSGQPFAVDLGGGTDGDSPPAVDVSTTPSPATAAIGDQLIIPISVGGTDELACFDATTESTCSGSWPAATGIAYAGNYGAPFPMLDAAGEITGVCLPTGTEPCFTTDGASTDTPAGLADVIGANIIWNGPAVALGPRVYVPNGEGDQVECFDYSTDASCSGFPKTFDGLELLYTVNADPERPTCLWVNSDDGDAQIQSFDAYTGGACGEGPIRALASKLVVPKPACAPAGYVSLQVVSPDPSTYTDGSVAFDDGDGNQLQGASDRPLDSTGTVDLTGLDLDSPSGLPQFLITLNGSSGAPSAVVAKLTWTGDYDPSCYRDRVDVSLSRTSIRADGTSTSVATATVTDQSGRPVTGDAVRFTSSGGQAIGPVSPGSDPGTYNATITSTTAAGPATITATDTSAAPNASATATLIQSERAAYVSTDLSSASIAADGTSTSVVTVAVTDVYGDPVVGDALTIASSGGQQVGPVTDNGDGTYSATVTSTTTVGISTITATDTTPPHAPSGTALLTQSAGQATSVALSLSPASIKADGSSSSTATATVTDANGNPKPGEDMTIGSSGSQVVGAVSDHGDGTYTATITSTLSAGTATITATDTSAGASPSTTAMLTQTNDKGVYLSVTLSRRSINADGTSTSDATATVTDQNGNPVSGGTVVIASSGAQSVGPVSAGDDPGTYTATITSSTVAGTATISATDTSESGHPSGTTILTQTAGPVAHVAVALEPASINADGVDTSTAIASVTDAHGNPIAGDRVTFASSGPQALGAVTPGLSPGLYRAVITSTTNPGDATITATDAGVSGTTTLRQRDVSVPTVLLGTPVVGGIYLQHQAIDTSYSCVDPDGPADVKACAGPVRAGSPLDTRSVGTHTFIINTVDASGNASRVIVHYDVVARPSASRPRSPFVYLTGPVTLTDGSVSLPLGCASAGDNCAGPIRLRVTVPVSGAGRRMHARQLALGFARYSLARGARRTFHVSVNAMGVRMLVPAGALPKIIVTTKKPGPWARMALSGG